MGVGNDHCIMVEEKVMKRDQVKQRQPLQVTETLWTPQTRSASNLFSNGKN